MLYNVYGILGGTFDPPHVAHLAAAHAAYEQMGLDVVRLLPARTPWQKVDRVVTSAKHRWAMCQLAAAEASYLVADDTEMHRRGPTYTIDTLEALSGDAVLILGSDTAVGIPSWHRADEVLERATIAVVPRPTVSFDEVTAAIGTSYTALDMPTLDLSATQIRDHVRAGLTPAFLVPQSVLAYVEANDLYRNRDA
jgi:nicotinate-nucleotide adenylyltransferase